MKEYYLKQVEELRLYLAEKQRPHKVIEKTVRKINELIKKYNET